MGSGTASPPTCSTTVPTCAPCRCCWGTVRFRPPRSTPWWPGKASSACTSSTIRAPERRRGRQAGAAGTVRESRTSGPRCGPTPQPIWNFRMNRSLILSLALGASLAACAAEPAGEATAPAARPATAPASAPVSGDTQARVRQALESLLPGVTVGEVRASPLPGLMEAGIDGRVLYVTEDGRFLIQGALIDVQARDNLTRHSEARMRKALLETVDIAQRGVVFPAAREQHVVKVFTDIDCGFCRRMHRQI